MIFWISFSYFVSHSWGIPMMKITGLSHLFKWENLHNWWLTKYFFAPLYIQPASQSQITCNHTSPGPPHPASSPPRSSETSHPDSCCNNRFADVNLVDWVANGGGEVMVWAGVWYGQVYVMDNEHWCILLMAFWKHRGTVTRSWGPLLCHSSTTITSCCSKIMHGPMLQGSVHNSWKLNTSQFLHGQHTHLTCHPMSMFGMLWIGIYDSVFQFLSISSNFAQPLKKSGPTFHRPQSTTRSTLCEGDGKWWSHQILTGVWTPPGPPPPPPIQ